MKYIYILLIVTLNSLVFSQQNCDSLSLQNYTGDCNTYHENGRIKEERHYVDGKPSGKWMKYDLEGIWLEILNWESKTIIRNEDVPTSSNGPIECYANIPEKKYKGNDSTEIVYFPDIEAIFPGGVDSLKSFISNNIIYPETALKNNIEGKVLASFIVEKDGSVIDIQIFRGLNPEMDLEVIRVLGLMPTWIPAEDDGKPAITKMIIPVKFVLPEPVVDEIEEKR